MALFPCCIQPEITPLPVVQSVLVPKLHRLIHKTHFRSLETLRVGKVGEVVVVAAAMAAGRGNPSVCFRPSCSSVPPPGIGNKGVGPGSTEGVKLTWSLTYLKEI